MKEKYVKVGMEGFSYEIKNVLIKSAQHVTLLVDNEEMI